jgi:murein DD-endopeptidase MepM/ murein hydrolase activator NlpD
VLGMQSSWINVGAAAVAASMMLMAPAAAEERCGGAYVIAPGDTLSRIAARCGLSVEALMRANPRITSPARIAVGWRLTVPGGSEADASAAASEPVALIGRIVNGRRCAMIETADGESYGVVSPDLAFVNGALVEVTGQVVDDPSCTGPRTLLVDELTRAAPT